MKIKEEIEKYGLIGYAYLMGYAFRSVIRLYEMAKRPGVEFTDEQKELIKKITNA